MKVPLTLTSSISILGPISYSRTLLWLLAMLPFPRSCASMTRDVSASSPSDSCGLELEFEFEYEYEFRV
jgi:hypothetical protein